VLADGSINYKIDSILSLFHVGKPLIFLIMQLPEASQRIAALLKQAGHPHTPVMLDDAARTAQQAADALNVQLGQIAKSIIFRRKPDDAAVLVITSGDRRVDEKKVQALVCAEGQKLSRADADFVKAKTGFAIGGVSPIGHLHPPVCLIDQELSRFDAIWAAAGHPHAVFELTLGQLKALTQAPVADVAQEVTV
jgi:prolyl-tRNA editing enzyme YbaK/EbsC (Cys-tRNA(Pro) deacylase)